MNIIKLNAIDSTNRFLKDLAKKSEIENFTVVVTEEQLAGKGQMNTVWDSEKGKNLLFTVYVELKGLSVDLISYINFLCAVKMRDVCANVLEDISRVKVKWPNDIMSYNDKISGILIENVIRKQQVDACFIGVGLNVNQLQFSSDLTKANSLANIKGVEFDKEIVLEKIIIALEEVMNVNYIVNNLKSIKKNYLNHLYKINIPTMFMDKEGNTFMGKIVDVSNEGLLLLEKEDGLIYNYAVKEIKLL
ncbi:biotin--[acetyl-CoA-carboxylase] ligase [Wenyingzhuangia marina]|uniref:BirA family transcriptional regulator, biotin operon repressor / biotin-[acetyl-CoA-carboxylase] ligase n=1 Tax=Wenyingzhuangia marina TaxID=1195760 RepID=A0A1M5W0C7_9FLAO|nr:biotin--[acetyl-CoA-carboxylase] ligase [Wenyingzhuangia marina]GGF76725.1 biotin--[acetyl-CoA-carboxylase] ligase [Wenyingzhuangia marina]SHH80955.1 BirA family transcriptional regulator, biotin operon repressor / biotin-[acetyl-CoA-carboxylase] ligase [Wenyingzhuangia marina]